MKKMLKFISCVLAVITLSICFVSCDKATKYDTDKTGEGENIKTMWVKEEIDSMTVKDFVECEEESDFVLIRVKDYGEIVAVLREDVAPISVKNFKNLVKSGFYSGTIFHRVMDGFMIQGGGYIVKDGKWAVKNSASIKGEFSENGFTNNLYHIRGVLSMARTSVPDSASSQFFIMHGDKASLDNKYAAFGYVLAGMDVVDAIATCPVDSSDPNAPKPITDVVIESVTFVKLAK